MNPFKMYPTGLTCLCLLLAFVNRTYSATVTLNPVADTTLFELSPDSNMGGNTTLVSGKTGVDKSGRALIRFALTSSVPENATIISAQLTVIVVKSPNPMGGPVDSTNDLHRMLRPWIEGIGDGLTGTPANAGEPTWNSRSHTTLPNASTLWSAPGAAAPVDFVPGVSASTFVEGNGSYVFTDLAADVQFWLNNPASNFGWILISEDEATAFTARRFGNREDAVNAPVLTIEYTLPPRPHIDSVATVSGNKFRIQFNARAGHAYAIECRDSFALPPTTCTNLPVQAVTGPVTVTLPMTGAQRFVRVGEQ